MNILNPYGYDEVFASPVRSRSSFLFDLTAAKPAAAFSLDRLNPNFTGDILQVRRSSDNAETGIGFAGNGLDVGGLEAFAGAGDAFVTQWYNQRVSNSESVLLPDSSADSYATVDNTVDNGDISGKKISFSTVIEAIPIGSEGLVGVTDSDGFRFDVYFPRDNEIRVFQKNSADTNSKYWDIPLGFTLQIGEKYDIEVTYGTDGNAPTNVSINNNDLTVPTDPTATVSQSATTSKFYIHTIGASVGGSNFTGNNPVYDFKVFETDETTIQHSWKLNNEGDGFVDTINQKPFSVQQGSYSRVDKSDTSVIANDAVQTPAASQPRIVNNGVVEKENGKPALNFDGADDEFLVGTGVYSVDQPVVNHFSVQKILSIGLSSYVLGGQGDAGYEALYSPVDEVRPATIRTSGLTAENGTNVVDVQHLIYQIADRTILQSYLNGTLDVDTFDRDSNYTDNDVVIGSRGGSSFLDGTIQEIIVYTSDQTANREIIEANIKKRYNI